MKKDITASLLKRLGEAADGYRGENDIYIVASYTFPHELSVFNSESKAKEYYSILDQDENNIFGPYNTPIENPPTDTIISIIVNIEKDDGSVNEIILDPKEYDALFFSESAKDKFLYPYYTNLYGVEFAAKMKKDSIAAAVGHIKQSTRTPI